MIQELISYRHAADRSDGAGMCSPPSVFLHYLRDSQASLKKTLPGQPTALFLLCARFAYVAYREDVAYCFN
jgi:hypothetical protein